MPDSNSPSGPAPTVTDVRLSGLVSRFAGRIIALFVHDINNQLATLRETSGLGDDIMRTKTLSDREKLQELEKVIHSMENRTGHTSSLVRGFDNVGRQMSASGGTLDVRGLVEGLFPFLAKLARQKDITIHLADSRDLPSATGNAPAMQCLLFAVFENLCASLEQHAVIRLSTERTTSSSIVISLAPDRRPGLPSNNEPWQAESIELLAAAVPSDIKGPHEGGAIRIEITQRK